MEARGVQRMGSILLTVMAIGIASNLDNAGVGIAYGLRRIRIAAWANGLISAISGVATLIAGLVGHELTRYVPTSFATWLGAILIIGVGLWVATESLRQKWRQRRHRHINVVSRILQDPVTADFDHSQTIGLSESLILGVALAINALAGGFDAGALRLGVVVTALTVALFSYGLLALSIMIGRRFAADAWGNRATYIAGILLIMIGLHQIW